MNLGHGEKIHWFKHWIFKYKEINLSHDKKKMIQSLIYWSAEQNTES